ncbi:MAG: hypothetical protein UY76_C0004G0004 [Candidatus Uhrbacteria bacterium GW2011_GWA2_52_8d]|uniref:Uncharacterized protein n=1 Tax=Candidatus Uhrbacteria bacterium GW2011_GWA2_52_8d TaxID=1618979 RepID=A0A0G1ZY54_9BACT|nr:MAG: hypothetical protein UY76_C0004G0004 [Candidatus Uhrbacteria bacterium GW2011_GWA2_52_8d]
MSDVQSHQIKKLSETFSGLIGMLIAHVLCVASLLVAVAVLHPLAMPLALCGALGTGVAIVYDLYTIRSGIRALQDQPC